MSVAIPSLRGAIAVPEWGKNELWRKARVVPSLDLRFADLKSLVDATTGNNLVTFTRGGSGAYVGSDRLIKTATTNEPRFDHDPTTGESLGLLVEESRTNLLLRSEEFNQSPWATANSTVTPNQAVAPNGTTTADLLVKSAEFGSVYQLTNVSNLTTHTVSVYVKKETNTNATLIITDNGTTNTLVRALINLDTGVVTNVSGTTISVSAGNGWYRLHSTYTYTNPLNRIFLYPGVIGDTSTGGIYLWGAQLEEGSFPTSYIPTEGSAVTRAADVVSISGSSFSSWYNASEGTAYVESRIGRQNTVAGAAMCGIETGVSNAEAIYMHYQAVGSTAFTVFDDSVKQVDQAPYPTAVPANTLVRQAGAFKLNDSASTANGGAVVRDTVCTVPTPDRMLIGFSTIGNAYLGGTLRRLTFWPQRLSNSVLQTITL